MLSETEQTQQKTITTIERAASRLHYITWGCVWILGFSGTYFMTTSAHPFDGWHIGLLWFILNSIGGIISGILGKRFSQLISTQNGRDKKVSLIWLSLFLYGAAFLMIIPPSNPYQLGTIIGLIPMLAYVIIGVWMNSRILWIGLIISTLILTGYWTIGAQPLLWLWFAGTCGGGLLGYGLFTRKV